MKKFVGEGAKALMHVLMSEPPIYDKVVASGKTGKTYVSIKIENDGTVILGETSYWFWNQLIGCQHKLPFEKWALTVWDALVDLSSGINNVAIQKGLSAEIAEKAQRSEDYECVVKRLYEVLQHVCNKKSGPSSAGDQGDMGSGMTREVYVNGEPVQINVHAGNIKKTLRVLSGDRANLCFDLGVVGVRVEKN